MKSIASAILLAFSAAAFAAGPVGVYKGPGGSTFLYAEPGPTCVNGAYKAEYVPLRGKAIGGCWKAAQGGVHIVFFDGDAGLAPSEAITKPEML